jgi:biotin carboxyl carrier protein
MNYQINIGEQSFPFDTNQASNLDMVVNDQNLHVLKDNKAYDVKIIATNFNAKTLTLEVNGNKYDLQIEDEYDLLVKKMGLSAFVVQKMTNVKAPMPGLIVEVLVKPGQAVEKGTQLIILEAMKMENVLKAEGEGVVKSIEVVKGAAVDKGQILILMDN